mmetsp:Transcript_62158/g.165409  ORF Transcript_62158/g.165409 Transcript_62158/m.165409 type:complete len:181 (+) Transcript_62158:124-666(+)
MATVDMSTDFGLEVHEAKLRRANERSKTCYRKRVEYERSRGARGAGSVPPRGDALRGAVRAASRACLSRGAVETGCDLPSICKAERSYRRDRQKSASVSPMLKAMSSPTMRFRTTPADFEEHAWPGEGAKDFELPLAEDAPSTQAASDSEGGAGLLDEDEDEGEAASALGGSPRRARRVP